MADPPLTTVGTTDWTMLRAIARRMLCTTDTSRARHPSNDQHWEVQRSALRLSSYIRSGEMAVQIVLPEPEFEYDEIEISIIFDDGLEPIIVPWSELEFALEPAPRFLGATQALGITRWPRPAPGPDR